jgi:plasmid stabilization system protein ParE
MTGVVWTLGAEADVQAIYERLESWEEGTGDRFYSEVLTGVGLLTAFPRIGPIVHCDKVRRVLVFNRNFGLFYVPENRGIVIHALLDLRQNPKAIDRRLEGI